MDSRYADRGAGRVRAGNGDVVVVDVDGLSSHLGDAERSNVPPPTGWKWYIKWGAGKVAGKM